MGFLIRKKPEPQPISEPPKPEKIGFRELLHRASEINGLYSKYLTSKGQPEWNSQQLTMGLFSDVGEISKIFMTQKQVEEKSEDQETLKNELADSLWMLMVLAQKNKINLEEAFFDAMDKVEEQLKPIVENSQTEDAAEDQKKNLTESQNFENNQNNESNEKAYKPANIDTGISAKHGIVKPHQVEPVAQHATAEVPVYHIKNTDSKPVDAPQQNNNSTNEQHIAFPPESHLTQQHNQLANQPEHNLTNPPQQNIAKQPPHQVAHEPERHLTKLLQSQMNGNSMKDLIKVREHMDKIKKNEDDKKKFGGINSLVL